MKWENSVGENLASGYRSGCALTDTGSGQVSDGEAAKALGLSWAGWLAAGSLPGHTWGEGSTIRLGRLQGETRFWPKAAKENRKPFSFLKPFYKIKTNLNSNQI
jgi:hypothetical protein